MRSSSFYPSIQFHSRGPRGHGHSHDRGGRGFVGGGRDGRGGRHHAIKRLLAHGDLRYVVLLLIEEKPRHGYELIKLIETKSSAQYSPSPGVIYPTLTYLEETGLLSTAEKGGKKQYLITTEGIEHLNENRDLATAIIKRLQEMGAQLAAEKAETVTQNADPFGDDDVSDIRRTFHMIKSELRGSPIETVKQKKLILEILTRTLTDLQALKK